MLKAALDALARGFHIFPSAPGGKVPHRLAGNWGQTATNDVNRVVDFWTRIDPQANPCVACKPSQLLVVDLDRAKKEWALKGTEWGYIHAAYGPLVQGEDLFDEMKFKLGADDETDPYETHVVRTGSGGLHLYYRWPSHWPRISQASPVKGLVDVRGNGGQWGGYVLGEGSRTEAGEYMETLDTDITLPPKWIRQLVAEKPPAPKVQRPKSFHSLLRSSNYSGLAETVRNAGEGNRNNSLLWSARTMCEEGAPEAECQSTLGPAARDAGLGDFEIERTIQSAYRVQRQKDGR